MSTAEWVRPAARPGRRLLRSVVGTLPDGTPPYPPVGTVIADGDHVLCHLCGNRFRSVLAHLRQHGWDQVRYREAFGLERGEPLGGRDPPRPAGGRVRAAAPVRPGGPRRVRGRAALGGQWRAGPGRGAGG